MVGHDVMAAGLTDHVHIFNVYVILVEGQDARRRRPHDAPTAGVKEQDSEYSAATSVVESKTKLKKQQHR